MSVSFKKNKLVSLMSVALITGAFALTGCSSIEGADGATGAAGDTGDIGETGSTGADGLIGAQGETGSQGAAGIDGVDFTAARLTRFAALPLGSEVTGLAVTADGDVLFNVQHPSVANPAPFNKATVGIVTGLNVNTLAEDFTEVAVPTSVLAKASVTVAQGSYQRLIQEGDLLATSGNIAGQIVAADGATILKQSNDPDFNGYLSTGAGTAYLFTNWEDRPGGMSRIELTKEASGEWTVGNGLMVDYSAVQGAWVNCFGSMSPWGTPLSAEELYFDNTADWYDSAYKYFSNPVSLAGYLGYPADGSGTWPNPYRYGYVVEITSPTTTPVPAKLFSNGRYSHENSVVMPDQKTVYLSDDGTNVVFFKFVADIAGDLTAGTLYAAKFTQNPFAVKESDYSFSINWIELAKSDNTTIEGWISDYDGQTDVIDAASATYTAPLYITDADVAAWAADKSDNGVLDTVTDDRVAFLESRKAAAAMGATAEFRKMEGLSINYESVIDGSVPFLYMAMTEITKGMADGAGDVNVPANKCGIVYRMRLDSSYNISAMEPAVIGGPYDSTAAVNKCPTNNISSPDNIAVLKDGRVIIGEDTSNHENNMVWIWKNK